MTDPDPAAVAEATMVPPSPHGGDATLDADAASKESMVAEPSTTLPSMAAAPPPPPPPATEAASAAPPPPPANEEETQPGGWGLGWAKGIASKVKDKVKETGIVDSIKETTSKVCALARLG